jgi:hypothetical protein
MHHRHAARDVLGRDQFTLDLPELKLTAGHQHRTASVPSAACFGEPAWTVRRNRTNAIELSNFKCIRQKGMPGLCTELLNY